MSISFSRQKEQQRREEVKRGMPWRQYWHLYLSLTGTGILTAFAGVYLGLAPSQTGEIIFLSTWDALRRIFFAAYYALSFLLVAEGATLFAKDKLLQRDVEIVDGKIMDVPAQRRSMTVMLWVSVLAVVGTSVAAGTMLAAWLGALDQFVTIPEASQMWIVLAPPALLVFDAICTLIYQGSSKQSELDRWVQQQKRMAEAAAQEIYASSYVDEYGRVAPAAAARAARVSAMTDARKWAGAGVDTAEGDERHESGHGNAAMSSSPLLRASGQILPPKPSSKPNKIQKRQKTGHGSPPEGLRGVDWTKGAETHVTEFDPSTKVFYEVEKALEASEPPQGAVHGELEPAAQENTVTEVQEGGGGQPSPT